MIAEDITASPRLAGLVERYHTWPVTRKQNNAEHSWQVARIYLEIFGTPRSEVLVYIQYHDIGEIGVGDLPFPVKSKNPAVKEHIDGLEGECRNRMGIKMPELTDEERKFVKVCDLMEMYEYGMEEIMRGNRFAEPIVSRTHSAINGMVMTIAMDTRQRIYDHILKRFAWTT